VSRTSRKDRKLLRQRVEKAAERGLPAPEVELRGSGFVRSSGPQVSPEGDESMGSSPAKRPGWFSTWPMSVKILALTILGLLAFSLWQTISSSRSNGRAEDSPAAPVAPEQSAPQTGNPSK